MSSTPSGASLYQVGQGWVPAFTAYVLEDPAKKTKCHTFLAEYFGGKYAGDVPKMFETTKRCDLMSFRLVFQCFVSSIVRRLQEQLGMSPNGEAVRHVAAQPITILTEDKETGTIKVN